jgi:hypothetical protein
VEAESASLRVDWPVYPRRVDHTKVREGAIDEGRANGAASSIPLLAPRALWSLAKDRAPAPPCRMLPSLPMRSFWA